MIGISQLAATTHQAVCTKGDFFGQHRDDPEDAERDAAGHTSKPGRANHVVEIITTVTSVKAFKASKNK